MLQQRVAWQQHTMCWLLGHVWPLVCNGCTTTVTTTAACHVEHAMPDRANAFVAASAVQHPHIQVCKQAAQHTQLHSCTAAQLHPYLTGPALPADLPAAPAQPLETAWWLLRSSCNNNFQQEAPVPAGMCRTLQWQATSACALADGCMKP
jgi:hypothetical protein